MDNRTQARGFGAFSGGSPLRRTVIILLVLAALAGLIWFVVSLSHSAPTTTRARAATMARPTANSFPRFTLGTSAPAGPARSRRAVHR